MRHELVNFLIVFSILPIKNSNFLNFYNNYESYYKVSELQKLMSEVTCICIPKKCSRITVTEAHK